MRFPQWKKRQLAEKAAREAAEREERHRQFWDAVDQRPKLIEEQPDYGEPIDYSELGALWE